VLHGIDVSSYQSEDYSTSGLSFVFIKITEGLTYVNPKWVAQRTTARHAGLVTGFYHYPHIANSPTEEADHFLKQINLAAGDMLVLDWEWYGQDVSDARARSYKDTWLSHVKAKAPAHRVLLYCDRSNWLDVDRDSKCGDGLWIADPTTAGRPRIQHHWTFHQYSSTSVDKDVANFVSTAHLKTWAGVSTDAVEHELPAQAEPSPAPAAPTASADPAGTQPAAASNAPAPDAAPDGAQPGGPTASEAPPTSGDPA
jgi:hypothetical protein